MAPSSPLPVHIPLWYCTQDTRRDEKPRRARGRDVNIGAWSFVGLAAGSLVTVVLGVPWTTYIARRHTPPAMWSTPPVSRNQCRYDTRLDLYIPRCGRRSGMDAPMGAADGRGNPLWSWPCFAVPGCTVRCSAGASHGYGSSPLIYQTPLPLGEKIHICPFNEQS